MVVILYCFSIYVWRSTTLGLKLGWALRHVLVCSWSDAMPAPGLTHKKTCRKPNYWSLSCVPSRSTLVQFWSHSFLQLLLGSRPIPMRHENTLIFTSRIPSWPGRNISELCYNLKFLLPSSPSFPLLSFLSV